MSNPFGFAFLSKSANPRLRACCAVLGGVCVAILIFVVVLVAVQQYGREMARARRVRCHNNLTSIALALAHYEKINGDWPPCYTYDASGQPTESWRTAILRFLPYDVDRSHLAGTAPDVFCCPASKPDCLQGFTSYIAVIDRNEPTRRAEDGARAGPRIKFIVEIAHSGIKWFEPRDLKESEWEALLKRLGNPSKHPSGYHILYRGGRIEFVPCPAP